MVSQIQRGESGLEFNTQGGTDGLSLSPNQELANYLSKGFAHIIINCCGHYLIIGKVHHFTKHKSCPHGTHAGSGEMMVALVGEGCVRKGRTEGTELVSGRD